MEKKVKALVGSRVCINDLQGKMRIYLDGDSQLGTYLTILSDRGSAINLFLVLNGQTGLSIDGTHCFRVCLGTHVDSSGSLGVRDDQGHLMIDFYNLPWSDFPALIVRTINGVIFRTEDKGSLRYEDWAPTAYDQKMRKMPKKTKPTRKKRPKIIVANKLVINDLNDNPRLVMDSTEPSRSFIRLNGYLRSSIEMSVTHEGLSKLIVCGTDGLERVSLVADQDAAGKVTINDCKGRPSIILGVEPETNLPAIVMLKDEEVVCRIPT